MPQQEFNPVPGVSTNADCEDVINNNATDAEQRLAKLEGGAESIPSLYGVTSADAGKFLTYDSASDTSFNISSSDGLSPGQVVEIQQKGTGAIEYVGLGGISISSPRFTGSNPKSDGQGAVIRIRCIGSNSYSITGNLREERPLLKYSLTGQAISGGDSFQIDNVVAKGGFASNFSQSDFVAPIAGEYKITFNASLGWSNTGGIASVIFVRFYLETPPGSFTRFAEQALYRPGDYLVSYEMPFNASFLISLAAGQRFLITGENSLTITPDGAGRNECFVEWINDV